MLLLQILGIMAILVIGYFIPRVVGPIFLAILLVNILGFNPLIWIIFIIIAIIGLVYDLEFWDKV